eukprot:1616287-Pleurochrysis_carterae.AAC.1
MVLVCVASPSTRLSPSRSLMQSLPFMQLVTAVAATTVARQLLPVPEHGYTVTKEAENPLDQGVAMRFGVSTQLTNKPAKMHRCKSQNMQMRMHNDQSSNLQSQ